MHIGSLVSSRSDVSLVLQQAAVYVSPDKLCMWWKEEADAVVELVEIDPGALGSETIFAWWALSEEDAAQTN